VTEGIVGIDHALIGVRDLEGAREAYGRLGFTLTPRGSHIGWGTANYCVMFARDYVELLGIVDPAQFTNNLDRFLARRQGLMGVALAADDAVAAADALDRRGVPADGPNDLARRLELPDGTVLPAFKLLHPARAAVPGLSLFICQHLTPELIRRPEWLRHGNGADGILSMTVLAEDPPALAGAYETLLGAGAAAVEDGALVVRIGPHELRFVRPRALAAHHPGAAAAPLAPPDPAVLTLRSSDLAKTRAWLDKGRVAFREGEGRTVLIAPTDACGLWLEFRAAT